jgi:hypothetical protein
MGRQLLIQQAIYVSYLLVELKFNDATERKVGFGTYKIGYNWGFKLTGYLINRILE